MDWRINVGNVENENKKSMKYFLVMKILEYFWHGYFNYVTGMVGFIT